MRTRKLPQAPMKLSPKQIEALRIVAEGRFCPGLVQEDDGWHARWLPLDRSSEAKIWVDEYVRASAMTPLTEDAELDRHETLHDAWIAALRSRTALVQWNDAECRAFAEELAEWSSGVMDDVEARGGMCFSLGATKDGKFSLSCPIPRGKRALCALGQAAYVWHPLKGLRKDGEVLSVELTKAEASSFIKDGASALVSSGYSVAALPQEALVTAEMEVLTPEEKPSGKHSVGKTLSGEVKLSVKVAGQKVTAEEIRFLLDQNSPLVFFRDRWIEVNRSILKEALRALEKVSGKKPDIMQFALGIGRVGNLEIDSLKTHGWIRGLLNTLGSAGKAGGIFDEEYALPTLNGTLRNYQRRGVQWMKFLTDQGFGALLADDMGLGKTVQAIAWMLSFRQSAPGPVLVVAPLTLLVNWRREIARFSPESRVYVHQGPSRHMASGFVSAAMQSNVVVTSYGLLVRDHRLFASVSWSALVLDEAQMIKNPDTRAARSVRALLPPRRIALTGTPIENSLMDIWALEDFLNPGFLGDRRSFRDRFAKDPSLYSGSFARLRHALEPFVLRRLKSEKEIASELTGKREVREYCTLSPVERRAYEEALESYRIGEHTPGDALALLNELKLICDGEGKTERLFELLESIFDAGESALVFTQYAKVGARLQSQLSARFGKKFPFLHGGLSLKEREEAVKEFSRPNSPPSAFILSLRAGGYGINLTKAAHVIHFDRWWNPAVENQATDRAHRIGQRKDVFVHLMISEGTLEERLDDMLRGKMRLKDVLADGEEFWAAVRLDGEEKCS